MLRSLNEVVFFGNYQLFSPEIRLKTFINMFTYAAFPHVYFLLQDISNKHLSEKL